MAIQSRSAAKPAKPAVRKKRVTVAPKKQAGAAAQRKTAALDFPIVGIGASAGGLESVTALLKKLRADTGMALVVVQHLDPKHVSKLSELLVHTTAMPVQVITDGMVVKPNEVYVMPPDADVVLRGRKLVLIKRDEGERTHKPIDRFFESLAEERKNRAIGIVLSGTGNDGTVGLAAIKRAGGRTFAEAQQSARYFAMPGSAIAAGYVDAVATAAELAGKLSRLDRRSKLNESALPPPLFPEDADDFEKVIFLIRQQCDVDFSQYKRSTLQRRIGRRMLLQQVDRLPQYVSLLRQQPEELTALFNDLLINVTSFFRDRVAFEVMKKKILPKLFKSRQHSSAELRVWVPGCSTGEEVYSIAIAITEVMDRSAAKIKVQIFGTDLSEAILAKARQGIYPESALQDISPDRRRRFFVKVEDGWQIARSIRQMCTFARQNLCEDPPFSHLDLITCRNVLIYLGPALQRKVMPIFHYALNPGGCLMLGTSESIGRHADLFSLVDKRNKIYVRKAALVRSPSLPFDSDYARNISTPIPATGPAMAEDLPDHALALELQRQADQLVLSIFSPAGVVVDNHLQVFQFRGRTGPFFEHAPGNASLNLLQMVRGSLALDLRSTIHRAMKTNVPVRKEGLLMEHHGHTATVTVHVIPFAIESSKAQWYVVLFEETDRSVGDTDLPKGGRQKGATARHLRDIERMHRELDSTRESLQAIIEEREATNEELKSTNEELETAKEELQSANEELTTVNEELGTRNAELALVNNDLNNLLSSINIPVIIVDGTLVIRRVTPLARNLFNLLPGDVGRQISDINTKLNIPDLEGIIREVNDTLAEREIEVTDGKGHCYSLRVRPYRTTENKIDGAVITLVDIQEIKRLANLELDRVTQSMLKNGGKEMISAI